MNLRLSHTTGYSYSDPVSISFHQALLTPRGTQFQRIIDSRLLVRPSPQSVSSREDYYGNQVTLFTVGELHQALEVEAVTLLSLENRPAPDVTKSPAWDHVASQVKRCESADDLLTYEYCFDSPHIETAPEFAEYGAPSFPAGRPLLESALDLTHRIHREFRYDPTVTTISTPISEVLENRHGVCQDFAHLMIGCLRSMGLPARYISGYLVPKPGVVGAQASHAWVSVYSPRDGWVEFDPTNDLIATNGHIILAWGRDYSDISPLRGIVLGGSQHTVTVGVAITDSD
jgi:transglutaminase-like putative cysteine protease